MTKKARLFIYLSILLGVGFSLTSYLSYRVSRSAVHDGIVRNQLPLVGDNVYSEIQRDLLRPIFISSVMAQDAFLRDWVLDGEKNKSQVSRYLNEISLRYQTVTSFFVSEKTGTYYHPSGILKQLDPDDPADMWYYRVRDMKPDFEINVDFDAANENAMTIFVNYKILDYQGEFIGATGVGLAVNAVGKLIQRYQDRFRRRIFFIDQSGDVVMPRLADTEARENINQIAGYAENRNDILTKEAVSFQYQIDGNTQFVATRFIPELNWTLVVEQSDAIAVAELKNTLKINLGISFVVTFVVLALTLVAINAYNKALMAAAETEKDTNQRLKRLNQQKDKLLSIIGHDLRAPFTAFLGIAELLKIRANKLEPGQVAEMADDIHSAGQKAYQVLENLLEWAQVQWEDLTPEMVRFDVTETISANVDVFEPVAAAKEINLNWTPDGEALVLADRNMTELAVRNLIDNAIKFTGKGGDVSVKVERDESRVWISVRDTGIGMSEDLIASLLKASPISSKAGTEGEIGIGMGTSLVQEMVKVNGGKIEIKSEEGRGSEFRFSLPAPD